MRNGATCLNRLCQDAVLTDNTDSAPEGYDYSSRRSSAYWGTCDQRISIKTPSTILIQKAGPPTGNFENSALDFGLFVEGKNPMFYLTRSRSLLLYAIATACLRPKSTAAAAAAASLILTLRSHVISSLL
jgi:hypothetical protein